MIKLTGKIEKRKSVRILIIHSKKLSEEVVRKKNNISIKNYKNGLILKPEGKVHVTIAAKKRLQIAITKLIKNKDILIKGCGKISVYIEPNKWNINKNEIFAKSVGNPTSNKIPSNLILKKAAVRPNKNRYYLDISSKKLHELSKNKITKCLFNRVKDSIIIIKSDEIQARKLTPHSKKRVQIALPAELLTSNEVCRIKEKGWFPLNIKLNIKSFGLKISDFYGNKEEKELVEYLSKQNIKIKIKEPSDPYDMLLFESKTGIEVHNSYPMYGDLTTRHKIKPGMVRLRILEAEFLTKNKNLERFFVVLNKKWENGIYIQELINKTNKNVQIFFTNFKDKWYEKIGKKIIKNIG